MIIIIIIIIIKIIISYYRLHHRQELGCLVEFLYKRALYEITMKTKIVAETILYPSSSQLIVVQLKTKFVAMGQRSCVLKDSINNAKGSTGRHVSAVD